MTTCSRIIFRREDDRAVRRGNVEDFLKQRLTMNATALSNDRPCSGAQHEHDQFARAGFRWTLILVNGRGCRGDALAPTHNLI